MKISHLDHVQPRFPRGKAWLVFCAVVALSVAGVAIAGPGPGSTSTVSATFTATTISDRNVQACSGTDGSYELTHATYSGNSTSSDPNLNGAVRIELRSAYNTTKNVGWVDADVRIDGSTPGNRTHAELSAVNINGALQGFLSGNEQGQAKLLASLSGAFTSAGGFTSGSIGTGTATNAAIVTTGSCTPPSPVRHDDHGRGNGNGHGHEHGHNHG